MSAASDRSGVVTVTIAGDERAAIAVPAGQAIVVGRSDRCDLQVDSTSVSRQHLRLSNEGQLLVEDLGSANGTFVDGRRLQPSEPVPFDHGGTLRVGDIELHVSRAPVGDETARLLPFAYWSHRVREEVARATRRDATFLLARICTEAGDPGAIRLVAARSLRAYDVLVESDHGELLVMFSDCSAPTGFAILRRVARALEAVCASVRVATAAFPLDGRTREQLEVVLAAPARPATLEAVPSRLVDGSGRMHEIHQLVARIAPSNINVLLMGETGVGKEVTAERLHTLSTRAHRPFLRLNCAALSESLLESELFGHERGAFTGAVKEKRGLLETAEGGTVFLDEIGELPLSTQVKLLRVIEERMVLRVGALEPAAIDVRFVAATNRDLKREVAHGRFREDLFFRLNGVSLVIPPLRERYAELDDLVAAFAATYAQQHGLAAPPTVSPEARALMRRYEWPGNIRELRNAVERAIVMSGGATIEPQHLPVEQMRASFATVSRRIDGPEPVVASSPTPASSFVPSEGASDAAETRARRELDALERRRIVQALEDAAGNQTRAATLLGISRRTLINRLDKYGLPRPRRKRRSSKRREGAE